jgi:hypothetical protein
VGAFVSLGIVNALRPLSDIDRGAYHALTAVALFLSTLVICYLDKVHVRLCNRCKRSPTNTADLMNLLPPAHAQPPVWRRFALLINTVMILVRA